MASRLLPASMRPHVAAVYAFARVADDIADEGDGAARRAAGAAARLAEPSSRAVAGGSDAQPPERPRRSDCRSRSATRFDRSILPVALFDDLLSAFGQDTMTTRYASWSDVLDYCRRSANPVGRLVLRIAGYRDEALDRSSDALCTALQLTNFWQDFGRDWRTGRLVRAPGGSGRPAAPSEADLSARPLTPAWARAIEASAAAARATAFAEGRAVCDGVRGRLRLELRLTWLGGMRILERVEARPRSILLEQPAHARRRRRAAARCWRAVLLERHARP